MILVPIAREDIEAAWPVVEPFARQMEERFPDYWPVAETYRRATQGDLYLWLVWSEEEKAIYAVIGTEVEVTASGKRVLHAVFTAGHEPEKWMRSAEERLMAHAKGNDCTECRIEGRPGWSKALPDWHTRLSVTMTKEVT